MRASGGAAAALRRGPRIAAMRAWLPGCYACLQVGTLQMQPASVRASQAYRELDAAAEDCSSHTTCSHYCKNAIASKPNASVDTTLALASVFDGYQGVANAQHTRFVASAFFRKIIFLRELF